MKQHTKNLLTMIALVLTATAAWAQGQIYITSVTPENAGTMTSSVSHGVCTLTATPAEGYCITAENITAVKVIAANMAQAPRRAPGIDSERLTVTAVNADADPSGVTTYTIVMPEGGYDVEVEAEFQTISGYGLSVTAVGGQPVAVTENNQMDVLGDGSVMFDGNHTLTLSNATLSEIYISNRTEIVLKLKGNNKVENAGTAVTTTSAASSLTIVTDQNDPGTLEYTKTGAAGVTQAEAFPSMTVTLNGGLESKAVDNVLSIYVPIPAVVVQETDGSEEEASTVITFEDDDSQVATETLTNVVIEGILYTLNDQQMTGSEANDDGFVEHTVGDKTVNLIVLNTPMADSEVTTLHEGELEPGSDAYAEAFNGLTMKLPKGRGNIYIKNAFTDNSHELHVRIGSAQPNVISTSGEIVETTAIPYDVDEDTYVYIYVVTKTAGAPLYGRRRIGPKAGVSSGLGGIKISASVISPAAPEDTKQLNSMNVLSYVGSNGVVVKDLKVTSLADNAFSAVNTAYIDLSGTGVTGYTVDRTAGAFKDVAENTFIYMPAGNTAAAGAVNVVIGGKCSKMVMDDAASFSVAKDFTALSARLDRAFASGKRSTVYLPFGLTQSQADGYGRFYEFGGIEGSSVTMNLVTTGLKANTPYIFVPEGAAGSGVTVLNVAVKTAPSVATDFVGTYEPLSWPVDQENIYCFVGEEKDGFTTGMFARVGAGTVVPPFRAYMRAKGAAAPSLDILWNDGPEDSTAGITTVVAEGASAGSGWFTLSGVRLTAAPVKKGIYVHNGRKEAVK